MLPLIFLGVALAPKAVAGSQSVVNIINPLWGPFTNHKGSTIGDANFVTALGASVVGVVRP